LTGNDHEQFWSGGERGDPLTDHNWAGAAFQRSD
jgi:hypothetical protein